MPAATAAAAIMFNNDGSVSVMCQIADNGVNQRSTMHQIIIEELGVTSDQLEWLNGGQETVNFGAPGRVPVHSPAAATAGRSSMPPGAPRPPSWILLP